MQGHIAIDAPEPIGQPKTLHAVAAYLIATGNDLLQVSVATGFSRDLLEQYMEYSSIFNELVNHYKDNPEETPSYDPKASANIILCEAVETLKIRLAQEPETFTVKELASVIDLMSTRTNLGLNPRAPDTGKADEITPEDITDVVKSSKSQTTGLPKLQEALAAQRNKASLARHRSVPDLLEVEEEGKQAIAKD